MASGYYDVTNKTLGKGHYGVVKLGRHCLTGEPVAMKIIEKSRLNNDSLNQLGTEIRILFRLSEYEHPNILKLYQTIDTQAKLFLVTEYCGPHACDLHDYLLRKDSREGLSEKEAQIFFAQICSAISYCHSMGIVHRDLKPENILVTDYRHEYTATPTSSKALERNPSQDHYHEIHLHNFPLLKLIDFGFANQWFQDEKMTTSCGTLAYSAPELLLGEPYDGTKVDVWGLGLMLYILLYGGNPFMQINDNETLTKILDCSFATPARDNIDYNAVELLRSLIKRNPEKRLPIDAILKHKWFSDIATPIDLALKYRVKTDQSPGSKQATKLAPVVSPTLPSISEIGPLRNLNRSADDDQVPTSLPSEASETASPNYNRTRSLSITRTFNKSSQQQSRSLTRSSLNLERLSQPSPVTQRGTPLYRPTSPDVGGTVALSEEERKLHSQVIHEMFGLTKLIDSKTSIEASLKNARFAHRLFNQNSIQPNQFSKRKISTGLVRSLALNNPPQSKTTIGTGLHKTGLTDKESLINSKLSNDDYIYATYQLIRDKLLRQRQVKEVEKSTEPISSEQSLSTAGVIEEEDTSNLKKSSTKENDRSGRMHQQRKLLQPQHKMRDKFTSFFRSGSSSPNSSFSLPHDAQHSDDSSSNQETMLIAVQHEAFSDHHNESSQGASAGSGSNFVLAYALPLARKCSLVSEEGGYTSDLPEN